MAKAKGIMAYGTDEDRRKVSVLAQAENRSSSEWIINRIRREYNSLFGDLAPTSNDG